MPPKKETEKKAAEAPAAEATAPAAEAKEAKPKRTKISAPDTLPECLAVMEKHEQAFKDYMAARKTKNGEQPESAAHKKAVATMERLKVGYSTYWKAYTKALTLGYSKRKAKPSKDEAPAEAGA